ncbi:MAG: WD40/YVTN/BNR-like repeat-containing protein [Planctomycetota bacterium]
MRAFNTGRRLPAWSTTMLYLALVLLPAVAVCSADEAAHPNPAQDPAATPPTGTPPAGTPAATPAATPATPAATPAASVDMKPLADLRTRAQAVIAKALQAGTSPSIDIAIEGQPVTVQLVGVDAKLNPIYNRYGQKKTLDFASLDNGQVAAMVLAVTDPNADDAGANNLIAGLLYALDANALASANAMNQALQLEPDLDAQAKTELKKLQPIIAALHPPPKALTLPAGGGGGGDSGDSASLSPGGSAQPGLPPPSVAKTGYESMGLSGGGAFFCPAISAADPNLMMLNSDMSDAFVSTDGGAHWRMIDHHQLGGDTQCSPGFPANDPNTIYAANGYGGQFSVSHDRGLTWQAVGDLKNLQGEICIDPADPNRMLVGSANAVYLTRDAGAKWSKCEGPTGKPLRFHFGLSCSGAKANPALYAATDQGLWRSDDDGAAWKSIAAGLPEHQILDFACGANRKTKQCVLYATVPSKVEGGKFAGGVYRSTDGGDHWDWAMGTGINLDTQEYGGYGAGSIAKYYAVMTTDVNPQIVWTLNTSTGYYPPHQEACFRSEDMGRTWHATYFSDPRFKEYNAVPNWLTAAVGQSWQGGASLGWAINPKNPDNILKCDMGFVFYTDDAGRTWKNAFTLAPAGVTPAKDSGWLDSGLTNTSTWNYYIDPHDPSRHYICYTDIGFARSVDAGKTWIWCPMPELPGPWHNTTYELALDPTTPGKLWGAFSSIHDIPNGNTILRGNGLPGNGGIGVSDDYAAAWKPCAGGLPDAPALSVVLDPQSPVGNRTLYAGFWEKGVYKSSDDGKTWTAKSDGLGAAADRRVIRVAVAKNGDIYALVTGKLIGGSFTSEGVGLYRSTDGADHWKLVPGSNKYLWPKGFTLDPDHPDTLYISCADPDPKTKQGGLYRTTDAGLTWKLLVRKGREHFGAFLSPKHPGWIYMTLSEGPPEAGLYLSQDNGATWTPYLEMPFGNAQRVAFDPKNDSIIYVCTFGGSIFKLGAVPRAAP